MYRIYAHYEAYQVDNKGIKTIHRGIVYLDTPEDQINGGANLKGSVIKQVTRQFPELENCPILMMGFGYVDEDESEAA